MAVPSYSHDLTDIDLAETTTGYVAYGGGASGLGAGADFAMQGTNCLDKQITNAEKGILYNNGAGITMAAGDHVFTWHYTATAGVTDTLANRGVVVNIGSGTGAFVKYHVEGSDTFGAGGRVARCYPIDQTVQSSNTGAVPYRTLVGSPSGTLQYFGSGLSTTATVKSANMGLDAQRYGTGAYLTAGELISEGDASDDPCTFDAYSVQNDAIANRWGILTKIGAAYELQGKFVIGQNNTKTATLARFEASDVNVSFVDTVHAASGFTEIIIDHASTVCNWTNVSFTALGTINKGKIKVNTADPVVIIVGGTWTDIGSTWLRASTTITGLTWRRCQIITLNGATLTDCIIDKSTGSKAVLTDDLADITGCTFNSDGTGYAVELSSIGGGTMSWDNTESGYAGTDGSTGNETIYVNVASGSLTINVVAGASTPTIRTAGATVSVVAGLKTLTIQAPNGSEVRIRQGSYTIQHTQNVTGGEVAYTYSFVAGTVVTISAGGAGLVRDTRLYLLKDANATITFDLENDPSYLA